MMTFPRWTSGLMAAFVVVGGQARGAAPAAAPSRVQVIEGRDLFHREWVPNDARSHGGDGLGPVFNDSSCVACHNLGSAGGAGPASKNVDILSASSTLNWRATPICRVAGPERPGASTFEDIVQAKIAILPRKGADTDMEELVKVHAGFRSMPSVILHRFGSDPTYDGWRFQRLMGDLAEILNEDAGASSLQRQVMMSRHLASARLLNLGGKTHIRGLELVRSQRNTSPLFGVGLIDAIPDAVLEQAAQTKYAAFPKVHGRVSRLGGGRIGRFGWKSQTASLGEFVLSACAQELGLEVPGHPQGGNPLAPGEKAPGLDLTVGECRSLVAFVSNLPRPMTRKSAGPRETTFVESGKEVFARIGCATCHSPTLGEVDEIYSDLLLHDMGDGLADTGAYGIFVPDPPDPSPPGASSKPAGDAHSKEAVAQNDMPGILGAAPQEWRTPPLWGVRDSGPYLHDGRAETLEQAIAFHQGEGEASAGLYFKLSPTARLQLQSFLKTLVAPMAEVARQENADAP